MREVIFDVETTGLDFGADRIAEVAAVELIDTLPTGRSLHLYVNPQKDMPAEAFAIHGLSTEFLKTKPTFKRQAQKVLDFFGSDPIIAHNAEFDVRMVNAELKRLALPQLSNEVIDTLALSRKAKPGGQHSLDRMARYFGVSTKKRVKHGALIDCEILAGVYLGLRGGLQMGLGLIHADEEADEAESPELPYREPRDFDGITLEEEVAHLEFVREMKNPIWGRYIDLGEFEDVPF